MGGIKRLSVAVVVNYLRVVDAKGHATMQPVTADKLAQVNQLVKDAMGFDQPRAATRSTWSTARSPPTSTRTPTCRGGARRT